MTQKILFVDDDDNILRSYKRLIGYEFAIDTALGGREGLELLKKEEPYAVVISDMRMPIMNGSEFLSRVHAEWPDTVRMLLTGQAEIDDAIAAVNKGQIFRFLTKPCPPDILMPAIKAGLEQYRLVTSEKELYEKVLHSNKLLKVAKDVISKEKVKVDNLVESMPAGIIMLDKEHKITFLNRTAEHIFSLNGNGNLNGSTKTFLKDKRGFDLNALVGSFQKTNKTLWSTELNLNQVILSVKLANVIDKKSSTGDLLVFVQDVTKEKEAEKVKADFVTNVSHELRTPMTSIKNSLNIVLGGSAGQLTENQDKFLSMAMRNIDRLSRLINDVLDFSKLEAGAMDLNTSELDLETLVDGVLSTVQSQALEKNIKLLKNVTTSGLKLTADSDKIEQVLVNLMTNALKFTPESGKITVRTESVTQSSQAGKAYVKVSVIDTGTGISAKDLETLFQRFSQAEHNLSNKPDGTGLGLSISKKIVELHGGEIGVKSKLDVGSVFWFILPVKMEN